MKKGLYIDVVKGVEGHSLYIMNYDGSGGTGFRIAGPKPWGGGQTIHSFQIDMLDVGKINEYAKEVYKQI